MAGFCGRNFWPLKIGLVKSRSGNFGRKLRPDFLTFVLGFVQKCTNLVLVKKMGLVSPEVCTNLVLVTKNGTGLHRSVTI